MTDESRPVDSVRPTYRRWARTDREMRRLATAPTPAATPPETSESSESHETARPDDGMDADQPWVELLSEQDQQGAWEARAAAVTVSPTQARRIGEGLRACAGITVAIGAAAVTAVLLWRAVEGLPQALAGPPKGSAVPRATSLPSPSGNAAPAAATRTLPPAPSPTAGQPRIVVIGPQSTAVTGPSPEATSTPNVSSAPILASPVLAAPPAPQAPAQTAAASPPPAAPTTGATATRAPSIDQRVHTVERGDTLFSIARRNGTTVEALVDANGLGSREAVLSVGRRLVLP